MHPSARPTVDPSVLPWLNTAQMIEVDRIMIDELGIELAQMMENAGRNLAMLVLELFAPRRVTVFAGRGGNGGGGLVAARHLSNHGVDVHVRLTRSPEDYEGVPAHQLRILHRMGLLIEVLDDPVPLDGDIAIDALIGYSLRGAPQGVARAAINAMNASSVPVVSLDIPSGVDSTNGSTPGSAVYADTTLTLAAPKRGVRGNDHVGRLFVGDISVPHSVYERLGFDHDPFFAGSWIVGVASSSEQ